jgi:hypothetical protein
MSPDAERFVQLAAAVVPVVLQECSDGPRSIGADRRGLRHDRGGPLREKIENY